jgi:hypothetical protein
MAIGEEILNYRFVEEEGKTLLLMAIESGKRSLIKALFQKRVDWTIEDDYGQNAVLYAINFGNYFVLDHLLKHEKSALFHTIHEATGDNILHAAGKARDPSVLHFLMVHFPQLLKKPNRRDLIPHIEAFMEQDQKNIFDVFDIYMDQAVDLFEPLRHSTRASYFAHYIVQTQDARCLTRYLYAYPMKTILATLQLEDASGKTPLDTILKSKTKNCIGSFSKRF